MRLYKDVGPVICINHLNVPTLVLTLTLNLTLAPTLTQGRTLTLAPTCRISRPIVTYETSHRRLDRARFIRRGSEEGRLESLGIPRR